MTREEIEKDASELYGLSYFKKELAKFVIDRVNAALEEAVLAIEATPFANKQGPDAIRALKIT